MPETATVTCDRCGSENAADARFCSSCGNRLGGAAEEERKLVSVLFVDLEPYPAIRAWLDRVAAQPGHVPIDA